MNMELLFFLLPVAALSGWLIGIRKNGKSRAETNDCFSLSQDYFKGLNYLLDEQSDKALEVFIQMSELDNETIDLHFALASLFARRGEVDRAIRIHQNLIARPVLSQHDRNRALFELAQDYMRAGLLDRAESLFSELTDNSVFAQRSRRQLLEIYQQEKEWEKAIAIARRIDNVNGQGLAPIVAHYYCELAEESLAQGDSAQATRLVKRAFSEDKNCVRASLLEGRLLLLNKNPRAAIKSFQRVEQQSAAYLPLSLQPLQEAYTLQNNEAGFVDYLRQLSTNGGYTPVLKLSEQLEKREGEANAMQLIRQALQRQPSLRMLQRLLQLYRQHSNSSGHDEIELALSTLDKYLEDKPSYHCENCGYLSRTMQWQCPSCKQWNRVKPIHGIEGN